MSHFWSAFLTPNPPFTGFGARLLCFVSFCQVSHFCKNVCLDTVGVPTVAQKQRGQKHGNYSPAFYVFRDAKKHYFSVSLGCLEVAMCIILFNLGEGGLEADYFGPV